MISKLLGDSNLELMSQIGYKTPESRFRYFAEALNDNNVDDFSGYCERDVLMNILLLTKSTKTIELILGKLGKLDQNHENFIAETVGNRKFTPTSLKLFFDFIKKQTFSDKVLNYFFIKLTYNKSLKKNPKLINMLFTEFVQSKKTISYFRASISRVINMAKNSEQIALIFEMIKKDVDIKHLVYVFLRQSKTPAWITNKMIYLLTLDELYYFLNGKQGKSQFNKKTWFCIHKKLGSALFLKTFQIGNGYVETVRLDLFHYKNSTFPWTLKNVLMQFERKERQRKEYLS